MSNHGRVVHSGGTFSVMNNADLYTGNVVNLGIWEMQGDVTMSDYWGYELARFVNGGKFWKTSGTGNGIIDVKFLNGAGALNVWSGAVQFNNRTQQLDGLFVAEPGGIIRFNSGAFTFTTNTWLAGGVSSSLAAARLPNCRIIYRICNCLGHRVSERNYQTNGTLPGWI